MLKVKLPPLEGFFGHDTYDYLGLLHFGFLESALKRVPGAEGVELAGLVIDEVAMEVAKHAPSAKAIEISTTAKALLEARRPPYPFVSVSEKNNWKIEGQMEERVAVRWAGFAVLLAMVGGATYFLLARRRAAGKAPPISPPPSPQPSAQNCLALVVSAGKLRELGESPARAGDLLTQATYWWTGAPGAWARLREAAALSPSSENEAADETFMVLHYELPTAAHGSPSSRPDAASQLREAARRNELKILGKFFAHEPDRLAGAGFRR